MGDSCWEEPKFDPHISQFVPWVLVCTPYQVAYQTNNKIKHFTEMSTQFKNLNQKTRSLSLRDITLSDLLC